jgi:hypothetical protein
MAELKATAITAEVMTLESVAPPGFDNAGIPVPEHGRRLVQEAHIQGTAARPRQFDKLTLAGLAGVAIGSIGPWASALWLTVNGTAGDGKVTLAAAIVAIIIVIVAARRRWIGVPVALVGLGATAIAVHDIVALSGQPAVTVGWGLYLLAIAGIVTVVGSIRHVLKRR